MNAKMPRFLHSIIATAALVICSGCDRTGILSQTVLLDVRYREADAPAQGAFVSMGRERDRERFMEGGYRDGYFEELLSAYARNNLVSSDGTVSVDITYRYACPSILESCEDSAGETDRVSDEPLIVYVEDSDGSETLVLDAAPSNEIVGDRFVVRIDRIDRAVLLPTRQVN